MNHAAIAGGVAGMVESIVVQPLDIIKTRFQLSTEANPKLLQAFRLLLAEGGVLRFYRGLLPEMLGNVPTRTAMYAGKDWASKRLDQLGHPKNCSRDFLAGVFSGVPEAIATTPFQVVKIRMQNKDLVKHYANDIDCLLKILRDEGALTLFTGLQTTVLRNSIWNGVYFGTISLLSDFRTESGEGAVEQVQRFGTGLGAGILATCFNAPFDVAKSRIQQSKSGPNQKNAFGILFGILQTEGPLALYKGFTPKAWRMGIGGAVSFVTFDFAHGSLQAFGRT
eukprot:Skav219131  [mRNA]  locus=scaffold1574:566294:567133:+ [translate_table: standard]